MTLENLQNLKALLEQIEDVELIQKENELLKDEIIKLKEYKRKYLAIEAVTQWKTLPPEPSNETPAKTTDIRTIYRNGRTYGQVVHDEIKRRRMSLREVGDKCGLAISTIWEIKTDKHRNNTESKRKLEDGLKIKILDCPNADLV